MAELNAQVFLSCGQRSDSEKEITKVLARILEENGYQVYVALEQVTFKGLKEAILAQLAEAEYFLFVDFARETISPGVSRGSLFSHQELAIAAYLEIPYMGFRQKSVGREGLSSFMLSNVPEFLEDSELPDLLRQELAVRDDWKPHWRKVLKVSRPDPAERDHMITGNQPTKFFHLIVENLHISKMALGCTAYIEKIRDAKTGGEIEFQSAEIKWAGTVLPSVPIPPKAKRDLDACCVLDVASQSICWVSYSDSGKYMTPIKGRNVDVTYVILSDNFPPSRCTIRIEPQTTAVDTKVYELTSDRR